MTIYQVLRCNILLRAKSILQSELIDLYGSESFSPGRRTTGKVKETDMKSDLEIKFGSVISDKINAVRMSEQERQVAINAMHDADAIVDAILWVTHKVEQLGASLFLSPSIKH